MINEHQLRADIVEVCRRMYTRGLLAGVDGNVSARLGKDRLVTTPAGANKGYLQPEELVVVDLAGVVVRRGGRDRSLGASSELKMHLRVYQVRPEVQAVVHAHPPTAIARTLVKRPVVVNAIPEAVVYLGPVPTAPYATPGTAEVPDSIEPLLRDRNVRALMLARHGSLTLGRDVFEAFNRLDALEHTAKLTCAAENLASVEPLSDAEISNLLRLYGAQGTMYEGEEPRL